MSFQPAKRIRRGLVLIDPYFNTEGRFEFSRVVATILMMVVSLGLWVFREWLTGVASLSGVYGATAKFYSLTLLRPFLCLPDIYRWFSTIPVGDHHIFIKVYPIAGTLITAFAFASLYMSAYSLFLRYRHDHFRIGDYLGIWCVPLFISGLYFFLIMAWAELQLFLSLSV